MPLRGRKAHEWDMLLQWQIYGHKGLVPHSIQRLMEELWIYDHMVPYHSIIITEKSGNTAKYCGHSYDRLDYDVNGTNLEPTLNDYLIYQF